jgi:hypothetical protein
MNKLIIFFCLFFYNSNETTYIKGNGFIGYIFNEKHFILLSIENQKKRYTPSREDILNVEQLLKDKLKCENSELINQKNSCPVIHKNLKKYVRQYVGFINTDGEKIIWINLLWDKNIDDSSLKEEIIMVNDGCSYYWNVKINIDKKDLYELNINGRG